MLLEYGYQQYVLSIFLGFEGESTCVAFLCNDWSYLSMVVNNMFYQYFSAFKFNCTGVAFLCSDAMHCVNMVDKRYLVVGDFGTFWAPMLIFFMNVFIMLVHNCV